MWLLLSFLLSLAVTFLLLPPLITAGVRLGFVDTPDARKVHTHRIPRTGGVAIVAGVVVAAALFGPRAETGLSLTGALLVIAAFGAWDDRTPLDYRIKFLGQIAAALLVIHGGVEIRQVPFIAQPLPREVSLPLTLVTLLGVTNAVNLADGLDGLAGGLMLMTFGVIALLAERAGSRDLAVIAIAVMGSILAFLRFNTHPARVFMGDAGSQSLGFLAATLSIVLTQDVQPALSSALPLMLVGLPILDTLLVTIRRLREGRSPFHPDKNHLHHRLLQLGLRSDEAVLLIYVAHATVIAIAYALRWASGEVVALVFAVLCATVVAAFSVAARRGWMLDAQAARGRADSPDVGIVRHRLRWQVTAWGLRGLLAAICGYMLVGATVGIAVPAIVGVAALLLLVLLLPTFLLRAGQPSHPAERWMLYLATAAALYLLQQPLAANEAWRGIDNVFFVLLSAAVVIGATYCHRERFRLTTLDFLVIFVTGSLLVLPRDNVLALPSPFVPLKLVVLFYAVELLVCRTGRSADVLRGTVLLGVATVAARALL